LKEGVAIAGSHGKTTTTSLIATVLAHAGVDPTAVVGGKLNALGSNAKLGKGQLMVVEADESDRSFLRLSPAIAVITNIDPEHLDFYGTVDALQQAFVDFADRVPFYGLAVVCVDHPVVQHLIPRLGKRHTTYGISPQADWRADDVRLAPFQAKFTVSHRGQAQGEVTLRMVGAHNVLNALACCAVAHELGIPFATTAEALASFQGVQRRFTVRGEVPGPASRTGASSAPSSRTVSRAPATCSANSPPPSTMPTRCCSPRSTPPARTRSAAYRARGCTRRCAPAGTVT